MTYSVPISWESVYAAVGIGHCPVIVTIALPLLLLYPFLSDASAGGG